jgi:large-conductance mechanosensitive channel
MHERNTLLHSILDTISKQIEQPYGEFLKMIIDFTLLFKMLIMKWGILQKDKVGKCKDQRTKKYIPKKSPRHNLHLIEKEIKD